MLERLSDAGTRPDVRQQVAADGLVALTFHGDLQPLGELAHVGPAAEDEAAVALFDDRLDLDVVLVADLADDFLQQILDRHQTGGAAVLVHDHRRLDALALKLLRAARSLAWSRARNARDE